MKTDYDIEEIIYMFQNINIDEDMYNDDDVKKCEEILNHEFNQGLLFIFEIY